MQIFFPARCPYCGHDNKFMATMDEPKTRLIVYTCDIEEGGCDQPFVVSLELKPVVTIKAIEGYYPAFPKDDKKDIVPERAGTKETNWLDDMIEDMD